MSLPYTSGDVKLYESEFVNNLTINRAILRLHEQDNYLANLISNLTETSANIGNISLNDLQDVDITNLQVGDTLSADSNGQWKNVTLPANLSELYDVSISNPQENHIVYYNDTTQNWNNGSIANASFAGIIPTLIPETVVTQNTHIQLPAITGNGYEFAQIIKKGSVSVYINPNSGTTDTIMGSGCVYNISDEDYSYIRLKGISGTTENSWIFSNGTGTWEQSGSAVTPVGYAYLSLNSVDINQYMEIENNISAVTDVPIDNNNYIFGVISGDIGWHLFQDYMIYNGTTLAGDNLQEVMENLSAAIVGAVSTSGVLSFEGRTGDVSAVIGDYDADEITNTSDVIGSNVKQALDNLHSSVTDNITIQENQIIDKSLDLTYNKFGHNIAIDEINNLLLVTDNERYISGANVGSVDVFNYQNGSWNNLIETLTGLGNTNDYFGSNIYIDEDYLYIGANGINSTSGGVFVYYYQNDSWNNLSGIISGFNDFNGYNSNINSNLNFIFISDEGVDNVNIYNKSDLSLFETITGVDRFGYSLVVDNNELLVSDKTVGSGTNSGEVYRYIYENDSWDNLQQIITGSTIENNYYFGNNIYKDNNKIFISDSRSIIGEVSGAVTVFDYNFTTEKYDEIELLTGTYVVDNDWFGYNVQSNDNLLFIGAYGDEITNDFEGLLYVFKYDSDNNTYNEYQILTGSNTTINSWFSISQTYYDNQLFIGTSDNQLYIFDINRGYNEAFERIDTNLEGIEYELNKIQNSCLL